MCRYRGPLSGVLNEVGRTRVPYVRKRGRRAECPVRDVGTRGPGERRPFASGSRSEVPHIGLAVRPTLESARPTRGLLGREAGRQLSGATL